MENKARLCFETVYSSTGKALKAGPLQFVIVPLVDDDITWKIPAGKELKLFFCFKNNSDKYVEAGLRIDIPKRTGLSKTFLTLTPKDGEYWRVPVEANGYKMVAFILSTSRNTPRKEYTLTIYVWYSKKRTYAKTAASIVAGLALGRIGSAITKGAIKDEEVYSIKVSVI